MKLFTGLNNENEFKNNKHNAQEKGKEKQMFKTLCLTVIAVLVMAGSTFAQFDSIEVGGYVMVQAPHDSVKTFTNRWSVVKIKGYVDNIRGDFQYDLASNCMVAAQGIISKSISGGEATLYVGATFTAAGQITPAPNQLNGKNWLPIFVDYTFIDNGIGGSFTKDGLEIYAMKGKDFSFAATYRGAQILWQDKFAKTIAYQSPSDPLVHMINFFVGKTFFANGPEKNQVSACFNADYHSLRAYFGVNDGRSISNVTGIRWDVTKHLRLKGQYNLRTEEKFFEAVVSF